MSTERIKPWVGLNEEAFWSRCERGDGCWEWTGCRVTGYGQLVVRGHKWYAHRMAYALTHRMDPGLLHVLHTCDNPACCNPDHLFLGTHLDNMADMTAKGRYAAHPGESHGNAILTDDAVRYIMGSSDGPALLGRRLGVSPSAVADVQKGRGWRHVTGLPHPEAAAAQIVESLVEDES